MISRFSHFPEPEAVLRLSRTSFDPEITFESGHLFHVFPGPSPRTWIWPTRGKVVWTWTKGAKVEVGGAPEGFLRDVLGLEENYEAILGHLSAFPELKEPVLRYRGLRILRQDPWESALGFLNATLSSVKRVRRHLSELAEGYGAKGQLPLPRQVPDETRLREMGLGYRARFVAGFAKSASDKGWVKPVSPHDNPGSALLRSCLGEDTDATLKNLSKLPGVGRKVASCIALYSLNVSEAIPVDVWIARALEDVFKFQGKPNLLALERAARERYGKDAGYAQQFLYQAVRTKK